MQITLSLRVGRLTQDLRATWLITRYPIPLLVSFPDPQTIGDQTRDTLSVESFRIACTVPGQVLPDVEGLKKRFIIVV